MNVLSSLSCLPLTASYSIVKSLSMFTSLDKVIFLSFGFVKVVLYSPALIRLFLDLLGCMRLMAFISLKAIFLAAFSAVVLRRLEISLSGLRLPSMYSSVLQLGVGLLFRDYAWYRNYLRILKKHFSALQILLQVFWELFGELIGSGGAAVWTA